MIKFKCGNKEYTSKRATVNGVNGHIWTRTSLDNGACVHNGKVFVRAAAPEFEVHAIVDDALDFAVN
jgi:hypothetical protein